ncbi:MAG: bifunctional DNA-binding transcriptional regulator/O6-methylguanine-DNA methyltransferase Ada [Edaphobacter sp.]|uniref:bifunctional DNA-binding transcriptional regulator/O6-methylguanine-DNA methyltransferase Ada n=1 Tax=Edaphobacter sp. TaxID=1934404 RepID=UPI00239F8E22|nr:bifunctional DNA-binding transcriptional regulator/O6-methylguanine-DNA methyltransferase Ada [Edaphobacter sp.]MDE1175966.1 bifunctional DNA-binding transcriptional regulator/O6-methylguanine-DNA methyltransferase Ada [Edaphobacter sp.]
MEMTAIKNHSASNTGRRWQQVLQRDAKADGQFYYAVRSTGVVCKPSCPSRRPARENVQFFSTLADAVEAGYRACLRCEPDRTSPRPDPQADLVTEIAEHLRGHADESQTMSQLAQKAGVDRLTLMRAFRRVFGVSPAQYARAQRMENFKHKMRRPAMTVTDAIYDAGFGSSSRLYEKSNAQLGMTPREMKSGAKGITVKYATASCPLGRMLVAATEKGICSITFGEDDMELKALLLATFPSANLVADSRTDGWLGEAIRFVASQTTEHPLAATFPLDVRATAFQQRVWNALKAIPRGETRTYSGLATELGSPTATRAVAGACAANPVAIVVPCHRIIGKDGSLTGYRWGTERKRRLLEAEKLPQKRRRQLQ